MTNSTITSEQESIPFSIRLAELDEISVCAQLDASYQTDYVWQMNLQESERAIQSAFTQVRLPRTMPVAYPYMPDVLFAMFEGASCLLTAYYYDEIIGCLSGNLELWHNTFVIHNLIVHPQVRRRGVGKQLLKAARNWAYQNACQNLAAIMQTKNYPAIQFAMDEGFVFCGYNDKFYSNGDIALIYSLSL